MIARVGGGRRRRAAAVLATTVTTGLNMFDALSKAATWDPMGISPEEPSSLTDRLRAELKTLRAGVRAAS